MMLPMKPMLPWMKSPAINRQMLSSQISAIVLYGTFALLMFGPLAFGAVEPWSILILETGAVLLAGLWLAKQCLDEEIRTLWNPLFLPMAAFGILIVLQIALGVSAYLHDTVAGLMLYCAYALLCFLATQTLLRSSQARKIAVMLAIYGFVVACFALLQGVSPNGKLYWLRQPRMGGAIYGSYVNRNHYAGLMELLIPIPLVISLSRLSSEKVRIAAGIAAAIMVGTVFLSGSRGGMLATRVLSSFPPSHTSKLTNTTANAPIPIAMRTPLFWRNNTIAQITNSTKIASIPPREPDRKTVATMMAEEMPAAIRTLSEERREREMMRGIGTIISISPA